jgi:acyl-ACP thioesterase
MVDLINLSIDNYNVRSYHADFKQQLSIISLFNFLQESAWRHASKNAFGFYDLLDQGFFWALTRGSVIIDRYPVWGDSLRIETWSKEPDALIAYRDFEVFNEKNEQLFKASTAWLIVDIKSRHLQRMAQFKDKFPHLLTRHAIAQHPVKLPALSQNTMNDSVARAICINDMDMNGHVNNANYVRWIIDSFPFDFIKNNEIAEIEVNFMHESKAGEHYTINITEQAAKQYLCNVVRVEDGCELARILLKFR